MRLPLVVLVLFLAGCEPGAEALYSDRPLFTFKDPSAVLKPGVWVSDWEGCEVDARLPIAEWPDCAQVAVVSEDFLGDWPVRYPYVIAPNSRRVLQIGYGTESYHYEVISGVEYDSQGLVTALRRDSLGCRIEPSPPTDDDEDPVEPAPVVQGPNLPCPVTNAEAVLDLAELSAPEEGGKPNFRWIRDSLD